MELTNQTGYVTAVHYRAHLVEDEDNHDEHLVFPVPVGGLQTAEETVFFEAVEDVAVDWATAFHTANTDITVTLFRHYEGAFGSAESSVTL